LNNIILLAIGKDSERLRLPLFVLSRDSSSALSTVHSLLACFRIILIRRRRGRRWDFPRSLAA